MKKVLVVAPHPDDETLACGGTILKHKKQGHIINWLIVTGISEEAGYPAASVSTRNKEIETVAGMYDFDNIINLRLPTTMLDTLPMADLVKSIGDVIHETQPEIVYLPYRGDVHTDHKIVFDAVVSCTKWFRHKSIKRVLAYETISETDFGINPDNNGFKPNVFIDISNHLERKIEIFKVYSSEVGSFPFPRSEQSIRALAAMRGVTAGFEAAEAFMLLRETL